VRADHGRDAVAEALMAHRADVSRPVREPSVHQILAKAIAQQALTRLSSSARCVSESSKESTGSEQ
jgi:hypothetical protein